MSFILPYAPLFVVFYLFASFCFFLFLLLHNPFFSLLCCVPLEFISPSFVLSASLPCLFSLLSLSAIHLCFSPLFSSSTFTTSFASCLCPIGGSYYSAFPPPELVVWLTFVFSAYWLKYVSSPHHLISYLLPCSNSPRTPLMKKWWSCCCPILTCPTTTLKQQRGCVAMWPALHPGQKRWPPSSPLTKRSYPWR